jgi:hypothetical protein
MSEFFRTKLMRFAIWLFNKTKDYYTNFEPLETRSFHVAVRVDWEAAKDKKASEQYRHKAIYELARKLYDDGFVRVEKQDDILNACEMIRYSLLVKKAF